MAQSGPTSAVRALQLELRSLNEEPVEGFQVKVNDENIFEWQVAIFGPPQTLYESGYFKALMKFPPDYPYSPPSVKFLCKMWHPNIYENGEVCISILHPPVDDPHSGELPSERWNPTQNVRTILLSIISLLNEPNTSSPANVDASVAFRKWRDSKGREKEYENIIRKQVLATHSEAEKDGVVVPRSLDEYCITARPKATAADHAADLDFYDDDDYFEQEDDSEDETMDEDEEEAAGGCADERDSGERDSGHGDT